MDTVDVLVIGAGPTGIGAAHRLNQLDVDWLLVETNDAPGGMAGSVVDGHGFVWDLGGHVLHSHFEEFDKAMAVAGVELLYPVRNGWVWIDGDLVPTPIQHHVTSLPGDLNPDGPTANLGDYYLNHFGSQLYRSFFKPFTEKMWATPLEFIDDRWTSLRSGSNERNVPALKVEHNGPVAEPVTFPYPAGGTGKLWGALAAQLNQDRVRYRVNVESIDVANHTARLSDGTSIGYRECISTMPLTHLLTTIGVPDLAAQASQFVSSQTLCVGLGYEGEPPPAMADKSWLNCPDPDVAWHRATVLSNYDPDNAGPDRWSVLCEIGRSRFRTVDDAQAIESCRRSMAQLGADPRKLVSTWTRVVPMGYPVPTRDRDDLLVEVDATLIEHNIRSRGRFGGWRYESSNQDFSFMQGVQAVDAALSGTAEDAYWQPEQC